MESSLKNTSLPYGWRLIHEIQLNDNFKFTEDLSIGEEGVHDKFISFVKRCMDKKQLLDVIESLYCKSESAKPLFTKLFTQLNSVYEDVIGEKSNIDADLYLQMILENSFSNNQMAELFSYLYDKLFITSKVYDDNIQIQKNNTIHTIKLLPKHYKSRLTVFIRNLGDVIKMYENQRLTNLNISLALYKRFILGNKGYQIEKEEVDKALKSGKLQIDKTYEWLKSGITNEKWGINTPAVQISIHRKAIHTILYKLSMNNNKKINPNKLPEILTLDINRLGKIQTIVRQVVTALVIWYIIKAKIPAENVERVFDIILTCITHTHINLMDMIIIISYKLGIKFENNLFNILGTAMQNNTTSLRHVFTSRILSYVCTVEENIHPSIQFIEKYIKDIRFMVQKLCIHYENVYMFLYNAILHDIFTNSST